MKKSNLNLSYHEQDGVLLPNICISDQPEDEQPLGRYGRMALAYLRENHPERYAVLKMDGNLMKTMHRVQRDALERMEHLTQQMLLDDPVPETEDLLERARHWNDLKSMAEKCTKNKVKNYAKAINRDKKKENRIALTRKLVKRKKKKVRTHRPAWIWMLRKTFDRV